MRASVGVLLTLSWMAAAAGPAAAAPPVYRIGSRDVLEVQVWREPDLSGRHVVDEVGELQHVLVGAIPAAGRTCEEVAHELRERLERDYLREARVVVSVAESARRRASVLGAVNRPGVYPLREQTRVLDLLYAAGGPTADADQSAALLRFEDPESSARDAPHERLEVDLAALLERGDLTANHPIVPGDVLIVAARSSRASDADPSLARVRVVGEVVRPGVYPLDEAATLLDAVLAAGGLTEYAAANRARLVRGEGDARREDRVRLGDLLRGRESAQNRELRAGDLIVVPESFF